MPGFFYKCVRTGFFVPPSTAMSQRGLASPHSLLLFALLFLVAGMSTGHAEGNGVVKPSLENGYGRLVFSFDNLPKNKLEVSGSVVILSFEGPVKVDLSPVTKTLSKYVTVARQDPDGRALRLAMTQQFKVNKRQIGKKLFVDILQKNWVGLPPALPDDVVAELARLNAEAEERAKEEERQKKLASIGYKVKVRVGEHKTFSRIVFEWNKFVAASLSRDGSNVVVRFGMQAPIDLTRLKATPPAYLRKTTRKLQDKGMDVVLDVNPEAQVRAFREGINFVVDITGPDGVIDGAVKKALETVRNGNKEKKEAKAELHNVSKKPTEMVAFAGQDALKKIKQLSEDRETGQANQPPIKPLSGRPFSSDFKDFDPDVMQEKDLGDVGESDIAPVGMPPAKKVATDKQNSKPSNPKDNQKEWAAQTIKADKGPPIVAPDGELKPIEDSESGPQQPNLVQQPQKKLGRGVRLDKVSDGLKLTFPFAGKVSAAVFRRARTVWVVFDTKDKIDLGALQDRSKDGLETAELESVEKSQIIRLRLTKPRIVAARQRGTNWVVEVGNLVSSRAQPLSVKRGARSDKKSVVTIALDKPGTVHWISDPEIGDRLAIVTAFEPVRNVIKSQQFVDFDLLATAHGLAIKPRADDLAVRLRLDDVLLTRGRGLTLSAGDAHQYKPGRSSIDKRQRVRRGFVDFKTWQKGGPAQFSRQTSDLEHAIAIVEERERNSLRLELARLFLSHQLAPETLGILAQILKNDPGAVTDPSFNILRGVANTLMGRTKEAEKDLTVHALLQDSDSALWRGLVYGKERRWKDALTEFQNGSDVLGDYPHDIQAQFRLAAARAALESQLLSRAADELDAIPSVYLPRSLEAKTHLTRGLYLAKIGHSDEAMDAFTSAIRSGDEEAAIRARLAGLELMLSLNRLDMKKAIEELQSLSIIWRGDDTELKTLKLLADLYAKEGDYRAGFKVMKDALRAFPKSKIALQLQDQMKEIFRDLFLYGKGDHLTPVEALGLFYDHRELTPIGRLGDEMIRRLADRLIAIDLLDQAAELLDHQVSNRLKGVARAQVAMRLAMVHLRNRKPELALRTLRLTRQPDLPKHLLRARDVLEARSFGELGRTESAIDLLSRHQGQDIEDYKADVYWNNREWASSGEQLEKNLGTSWQGSRPLTAVERFDALRAAISYSLANDTFALNRLRKKFYPKMTKSEDAYPFLLVTKPIKKQGKEFKDLVKEIASISTLDNFMKSFNKSIERPKRKLPNTLGGPSPLGDENSAAVETEADPAT